MHSMIDFSQNKKNIIIAVIVTLVVMTLSLIWFASTQNNSKQPSEGNTTQTTQNPTNTITPGANFTAATQSFLSKPEIEISTELNSFPKVEKNSINESYILNNQPLVDSNNFDKNILTLSEDYLSPEYGGESDITVTSSNRTLPKSLLPDLGEYENKDTIFLINDENFNLVNLGYGVIFFRTFRVENQNFHIVIKQDNVSNTYIYAGTDLTKLIELKTNLSNPEYTGSNINYFDNTIVYITATSQNPIEKSDYKEFHINVDELAKKDLGSRIEFQEQIVTPGSDNH